MRMKKNLKLILAIVVAAALFFGSSYLMKLISGTEEPESTTYYNTVTFESETESESSRNQTETASETQSQTQEETTASATTERQSQGISESGKYNSKDDVALYIHTYHHLPSNYMTKNQARNIGWEGGNLENISPGHYIGGDRFTNYQRLLPTGVQYYECDVNNAGERSRGAERLLYTADGTVYYTPDHYETVTKLY